MMIGITKPSVIAQGTIKNSTSASPDRVRFTNWNLARNNYWDYSGTSGSANADGAVIAQSGRQSDESED